MYKLLNAEHISIGMGYDIAYLLKQTVEVWTVGGLNLSWYFVY